MHLIRWDAFGRPILVHLIQTLYESVLNNNIYRKSVMVSFSYTKKKVDIEVLVHFLKRASLKVKWPERDR